MAEKLLRDVSMDRLHEAVRAYGLQKQLAHDLNMSDADLSRLVNEQAPRLCTLLAKLGIVLVDSGYMDSLKKVLKENL